MGSLGNIIDERLKVLDITQAEFATHCDISTSQLSLLRSGGRGKKMQADTAIKRARGLGISVEELFTPAKRKVATA